MMGRTKQTARKSTQGKAPPRQLLKRCWSPPSTAGVGVVSCVGSNCTSCQTNVILRKKLKDNQEELDNANEEWSVVEMELCEAKSELKTLNDELSSVKKKLEDSASFANDCLKSHEKFNEKIENLMNSTDEVHKLRKLTIGHISENQSLKQDKLTLIAKLNSVQLNLDEFKKSHATMVKENKVLIGTFARKNKSLKKEIKELEKSIEELRGVNQKNVDILARTRDELDEVTKQRDETLDRLRELQDNNKASACMFCCEVHSVSNYYNSCGHAILCETCAKKGDERINNLEHCPHCRADIQKSEYGKIILWRVYTPAQHSLVACV